MKFKQAILTAIIFSATPAFASAATLSLSPSSQSVGVNQTFTVSVVLNTQGIAVDGVDLTYLRYNSSLLQVQSVTPGTLMPLTLSNNSATPGQIQFSQVTTGGSHYNGQGTLLSVVFKGLAQGISNVTFDFTPGSTQDTNVAGNATDLLTAVTNGSYNIGNATSPPPAPSPTPTPTPSPTPTPPTPALPGGSSSPSGLTEAQIQAILSLMRSFGTDAGTIQNVEISLRGGTPNIQGISPPSFASLSPLISKYAYGQRGAHVTLLQQYLAKDSAIYPEGLVTGYYGPLTKKAIIRFQSKYGIEQTGISGPQTRAKLNELFAK